jgi:DNA-binding NarL/FixJ family response regulator
MTKILVGDDRAVVRDEVKRRFDEQPGTVVFDEASMPHEAIKLVSEQTWDLVVLDLVLRILHYCFSQEIFLGENMGL